tara:strand:+ start:360 stop:1016 length:657 start_codon:yes stop_codon:yes gene_type:complete
MQMNEYLIFGASGLTGNYFLEKVKEKGSSYHLFVRNIFVNEKDSNQTIFSFENIQDFPLSKNLVICLGYPLTFKELLKMDKKTKLEFEKVDFDLVTKIAKKAREIGIKNIAVVSAVGSSLNSYNFYLGTKARMEEQVLKLAFKRTIFVKPGHLLGPRDDSRIDIWVKLIESLGKIYGFFLIGPLKKYRNIHAKEVAEELFHVVNNEKISSHLIEVYES